MTRSLFALSASLTWCFAGAQPYGNIDNRSFNTRSDGPQSAIIVDLGARGTPEAVRSQVIAAVRAELDAFDRAVSGYKSAKVRAGLWRAEMAFIAPRVVLLRVGGRLLDGASAAGSPRGACHPHPALPLQGGGGALVPGGASSRASTFTPTLPSPFTGEGFGTQTFRGAGGGLTLQFRADGHPNAFPPSYRQHLVNTFAAAEPTMNTLFGPPYRAGAVKVDNMDETIGDRDAVAGGIYLPDDGTGSPAIWFPLYNAPETVSVNFIHTLYLAYLGPALFDYDAWNEGFARAATMRTVRAAALPGGLDPEIVQLVLDNSYDNSAHYSWYNQSPLSNNRFVAENLRNLPLPPGGSLGGIYLMRYRQAGTAWVKVQTEYPGFFGAFLSRYYQDPSISGDIPALKALAQSVMDTLRGMSGATIEGRSFDEWYKRQYILDTSITRGRKMLVEAIPIISGLGGDDFGVFAIWATFFETLAQGNETLLSGTCFPLFWDATFARLFTSAQEERMNISGAFGSVTPNFPDVFGTGGPVEWYKATVELPVSDVIGRTLVPAGAIATASDPNPKNFYGTVMGFDGAQAGGNASITGVVRLTLLGQPPINAQLRNGAFGVSVPPPGFNSPKRARVDVIRLVNGVEDPPLRTEFVNTWGLVLGIDIRLDGEGSFMAPGGLSAGIQMVGFPVRPFETNMSLNLNLPPAQTLVARWRHNRLGYDLWPSIEPFDLGRGYYVRLPAAQPGFVIGGRKAGPQPVSVALQAGWNQIVNPFDHDLTTSDVSVQEAAEFPRTYSEAVAAGVIGTEMFEFNPGAPDPVSGVPEGGTLNPVNAFPAGKAVFARVLVPNVSFTFRPSGFSGQDGLVLQPNWVATLHFTGLGVEASAAQVGQLSGAREGYDHALDSTLPPIWGGALQAEIDGDGPMFRDIRGLSPQVWDVSLSGLRRGFTYRLRVEVAVHSGNRPVLGLYDRTLRRGGTLRNGSVYTFTAQSSTHRFMVACDGGRR